MNHEYEEWLKRAKSCLKLAEIQKSEDIYYEDLCFQAQQSAEKALKAYLIFLEVDPPLTHSFNTILQTLKNHTEYPEQLEKSIDLNEYAVQTRYPGDYTPIDFEEYKEALKIANFVYNWVADRIGKRN